MGEKRVQGRRHNLEEEVREVRQESERNMRRRKRRRMEER